MIEEHEDNTRAGILRRMLGDNARRFHRDEGGAVMLLCLASALILFMVSLIIYDAGESVRDKIDTQNAADTAAYSTVAVKARTMNMTMYTNVAKRTIIGLHNMYFSMWMAYLTWWASRCSCCGPFSWGCCFDCIINLPLVLSEGLGDFLNYVTSVGDYYNDELEALDKYQEYFRLLTPWWGWAEGALRGSRNGATVASSYPPPPSLLFTLLPDWVDMALNFFGYSLPYNQTWVSDVMPVRKAGWWRMCIPTTLAGLAEFGVNVAIHQNRSQLGASKWSVVAAGAAGAGIIGCGYTALRLNSSWMAPLEPTATGDSAEDLMNKSNIQFAYRNDPTKVNSPSQGGDPAKSRDKYNFMGDKWEYVLDSPDDRPGLEGSGNWALARGEFFFNGGDPDPWKARWTGKLRPLQFPGEYDGFSGWSGTMDINGMYHDIAPFIALAGVLGIVQEGLSGFSSVWGDAVYMEKASRSMDNGTDDGFFK